MRRILVLSGAIASGKSQIRDGLIKRFGGESIRTSELLKEIVDSKQLGDLQQAGERLDRETEGRWVSTEAAKRIWRLEETRFFIIDAARIGSQIDALRETFPGGELTHVHIHASDETLKERYEARDKPGIDEPPTYEEARASNTEQGVGALGSEADFVIDTDRSTVEDAVVRIARALGLFAGEPTPLVDIIVGGEFGSEGKGNIAFYLAPEYELLVRVGGPNAGHTVYLPNGNEFTHHQLPSGTRNGEASLLIGPGAVLNPDKLMEEIAECEVSAERLVIDPQAMIIEPSDIEAEDKGKLKSEQASTAQGVGFATARRVLRGGYDEFVPVRPARDHPDLKPFTQRTAAEVLEDAYAAGSKICLEGTQGTGLSLLHGVYPKVTSRETTASGTAGEAGIAPHRVRKILLVCRTHPIRVQNPEGGTSGPLQREISWAQVEERAGFEPGELETREKTSTTNRQRRVGEFEWTLLRRSALLNAPTDVALTFVDYLDRRNAAARRFEQLQPDTINFIEEVERVAAAPVSLVSTRFHPQRSIIDRRLW